MRRLFCTTCLILSFLTLNACTPADSDKVIDVGEEVSLVVIEKTPQATSEIVITPEATAEIVAVSHTAEATFGVITATPFIKTPRPTTKPTEKPTPKPTPTKSEYTVESIEEIKGYVKAGSVNLRKGPGTDYKIIEEYERGDTLKINGVCGEWYRVKIDSKIGFMLKEYVAKGSMPTPTVKPTVKPTPKQTVKPTEKPSSAKYSESEIYLVAQVVYLEGRGGTTEGYKAIAGVILNRINSSSFPNTVEGVIFQKNQFTVARDEEKLRAQKPSSKIINAVDAVFNGGDNPLPKDVLFFRVASAGESWGSREFYKTIDNNSFFKW